RGYRRFDSLLARPRDHRAHLNASVEAIADANRGSGLRDGIAESFLRFADGDGNGNRQAALTRAAKRTVADDLGRQLHVRVGQNDYVILRPALALHALAAGRGARIDVFGDRRGADKADGAHLRMVTKR